MADAAYLKLLVSPFKVHMALLKTSHDPVCLQRVL